MMRAEAAGSLVAFLAIFRLDLRTVLCSLETWADCWAGKTWEPGVIRLRRTDRRSTREPVGVEKLSGRMGASTRSCHGEAGEPGESCGPGEATAIRSLEAERPAPTPRPLGPWGVVIRELTVTGSGLLASDFLGVESSSVEAGAWAVWSWLRCCSALWRSLAPISTMGTSGHGARLSLGFLVSVVGDSGAIAVTAAVAVAAAAVARVTRRRTEPFSATTVASFSTLSLLRRCQELSWLLRVFLRDNLPEEAEQKLRCPRGAGRLLKIRLEALASPPKVAGWHGA